MTFPVLLVMATGNMEDQNNRQVIVSGWDVLQRYVVVTY